MSDIGTAIPYSVIVNAHEPGANIASGKFLVVTWH